MTKLKDVSLGEHGPGKNDANENWVQLSFAAALLFVILASVAGMVALS